MPKLIVMPPLDDLHRGFAARLADDLPGLQVDAPETLDDAARQLPDADAAFGWIPPDLLPLAGRLKWLQNPDAGPRPGYFYPALIEHAVVICNPRGIYNDHIAQHIMMFLLALARGLPYYVAAQRQRSWQPSARPRPALDLAEAIALIHGVGGIGQETARLCAAFGMRVLGVDPRWEHAAPSADATGMSPPAMSRHLKTLLDAGVVEDERIREDARLRMFKLRPQSLAAVQAFLDQLQAEWNAQLRSFKRHVEGKDQ